MTCSTHPTCPVPLHDSELPPQSYEEQELLRLVYYGGIQHEIRRAVWPFLLGHYQFGMTEAEQKEVGLSLGSAGMTFGGAAGALMASGRTTWVPGPCAEGTVCPFAAASLPCP